MDWLLAAYLLLVAVLAYVLGWMFGRWSGEHAKETEVLKYIHGQEGEDLLKLTKQMRDEIEERHLGLR